MKTQHSREIKALLQQKKLNRSRFNPESFANLSGTFHANTGLKRSESASTLRRFDLPFASIEPRYTFDTQQKYKEDWQHRLKGTVDKRHRVAVDKRQKEDHVFQMKKNTVQRHKEQYDQGIKADIQQRYEILQRKYKELYEETKMKDIQYQRQKQQIQKFKKQQQRDKKEIQNLRFLIEMMPRKDMGIQVKQTRQKPRQKLHIGNLTTEVFNYHLRSESPKDKYRQQCYRSQHGIQSSFNHCSKMKTSPNKYKFVPTLQLK